MIIYRTIKKEEISKCIDLITDSYNGYSFYEIFVEDKKRRFKFLKEIQKVCVKTCYKQQTILVSLQDDKIVPIAILKSPNEPEPTIWNYLCSGGLNVFLAGGIKNTLGWLKMYNESSAACHSISEDSWYLTSLVIANEFKNQGLGSKMLQDGVIPYISQHGGGLLTLIINSESNCNFYKIYYLLSNLSAPFSKEKYIFRYSLQYLYHIQIYLTFYIFPDLIESSH